MKTKLVIAVLALAVGFIAGRHIGSTETAAKERVNSVKAIVLADEMARGLPRDYHKLPDGGYRVDHIVVQEYGLLAVVHRSVPTGDILLLVENVPPDLKEGDTFHIASVVGS